MKSFVIIGMGRFGRTLALELCRMGHEVVAIDSSETAITSVANDVTHAIIGDAKDEAVIRSIGARNFDICVVSIGQSVQDSVLITMLLKEHGARYVIAKAQSAIHQKVLERIGADKVVFPERDMGIKVAQSITSTNLIDFIELSDDYSILEMKPPKEWCNKTLQGINVRGVYGVNVLAVKKSGVKELLISLHGDYLVEEDDVLIVMGETAALDRISRS